MSKQLKKTNPLLFMTALIPVISSVLFVILLLWHDDIYIFSGKVLLIAPLEAISIVGVLILAGYMGLWGFIGSVFAKNAVEIKKSVITANIFPIFCIAAYTILAVIDNFAMTDLSDIINGMGGIGNGLMAIAGTYLFKLVPSNIFEAYVGLLLTLGVFVIGYSIGVSRLEKK